MNTTGIPATTLGVSNSLALNNIFDIISLDNFYKQQLDGVEYNNFTMIMTMREDFIHSVVSECINVLTHASFVLRIQGVLTKNPDVNTFTILNTINGVKSELSPLLALNMPKIQDLINSYTNIERMIKDVLKYNSYTSVTTSHRSMSDLNSVLAIEIQNNQKKLVASCEVIDSYIENSGMLQNIEIILNNYDDCFKQFLTELMTTLLNLKELNSIEIGNNIKYLKECMTYLESSLQDSRTNALHKNLSDICVLLDKIKPTYRHLGAETVRTSVLLVNEIKMNKSIWTLINKELGVKSMEHGLNLDNLFKMSGLVETFLKLDNFRVESLNTYVQQPDNLPFGTLAYSLAISSVFQLNSILDGIKSLHPEMFADKQQTMQASKLKYLFDANNCLVSNEMLALKKQAIYRDNKSIDIPKTVILKQDYLNQLYAIAGELNTKIEATATLSNMQEQKDNYDILKPQLETVNYLLKNLPIYMQEVLNIYGMAVSEVADSKLIANSLNKSRVESESVAKANNKMMLHTTSFQKIKEMIFHLENDIYVLNHALCENKNVLTLTVV